MDTGNFNTRVDGLSTHVYANSKNTCYLMHEFFTGLATVSVYKFISVPNREP